MLKISENKMNLFGFSLHGNISLWFQKDVPVLIHNGEVKLIIKYVFFFKKSHHLKNNPPQANNSKTILAFLKK